MANEFGPDGEPFDDFFARFFGGDRSVRRIDIGKLMTQQAHEVVGTAAREAVERGHGEVDALHILLAATRTEPTRNLLSGAGADPDELAERAAKRLPPAGSANAGSDEPDRPPLTSAARSVLLGAHQISRAVGSAYIDADHLLLALTANHGSTPGNILLNADVTPESLQSAATGTRADGERDSSATPTLDQYGVDLTARARDGEIDPVIGRDSEIEQTIEILTRRTKNNAVLIGEPGVGKTAIVEGLARRVAEGDIPAMLSGKRIVQLDISGMLAGTRYRGDFEERMTKVIDEIAAHSSEIIVFVDELHTVVGAGGAEGAVDAGNMLKPRLARGELHMVGATTLDEYRSTIESDSALERRFQPVLVDEPDADEAVAVVDGLRGQYEQHHGVRFTDDAITAAVTLSDRYITDRHLPDKAIDVLDQAGARKRLSIGPGADERRELREKAERLERQKEQAIAEEDYERASALRDEINALQDGLARVASNADEHAVEITTEDIAGVVSRATGVPVQRLTEQEKTRLQRLEDELHERVVGQQDAVHAIARSVRRSRAGLGDPQRPIGSFLFLGPTGVGKTELAKALAAALFGDTDNMVRLDMSEYQERHTESRLIGAPPGYVGYGQSGELTEAVRRRPYSVILLDEVEKAHPDVFNILLQVLDDGRLTDGQGRTVDFRNTVLIMTSNLGSDVISSGSGSLGFTSPGQDASERPVRERLMGRLKESFRPEFLNRIDEVVIFRKLSATELHSIADLLLEDSRKRLRAQGVDVEFTGAAIDWLAERGHQPEFGARPLRRTIQREVDDRLADLLLVEQLDSGQRVAVDVVDGELRFEVSASDRQAA
ncbi:ATP-dependent Clp protease ATP-binding subunit [Haloechinothrix sp. YIM 98757]|uniref:ATP-dependent Clp protease ATP-binding subunit n=1 Tax=Haloechinothrix aidingensis TaxID=2752311 RepID=A0A838A174_9PSEU|nr:ATP-dependent Clp protease ATP-binding subunit [Haloechinothrix aidingensis]MBA0124873.1 ATP-dependent Clp protease ATP-binding subunit [Haloechinothrix aidingensis]